VHLLHPGFPPLVVTLPFSPILSLVARMFALPRRDNLGAGSASAALSFVVFSPRHFFVSWWGVSFEWLVGGGLGPLIQATLDYSFGQGFDNPFFL